MPLLEVTRDFLARVEEETGFPVKLTEEPDLPTLAKIRPARGNVSAHFVQYKPTRDESLDYLICQQCGFVLRLFAQPPAQRYEFGGTAAGERAVLRLVSDPQSKLAQLGLEPAQLGQMAVSFYGGLLTHLRSVPIGLRIADWIFDRYPGLRASQRAAVLKELADAKATLQPSIREITPERILHPTMAINAALALFWADKYGMRELAGAYRGGPYESDGSALLKIWLEVPAEPAHDMELVDRWAARLQLTDWYQWAPYEAPF